MILMLLQETEQTVTFSPMGLWGNPPWYEKLLAWYVLAMLILLLVSCVQLFVGLRRLRKIKQSEPATASNWREIWSVCKLRTQSLTKFAVLTFFLSVFVSIKSIADLASGYAHQNFSGLRALIWGLSESLTLLDSGVFICILLYASGFFFESRLNRYKLRFDAAQEKASLSG